MGLGNEHHEAEREQVVGQMPAGDFLEKQDMMSTFFSLLISRLNLQLYCLLLCHWVY